MATIGSIHAEQIRRATPERTALLLTQLRDYLDYLALEELRLTLANDALRRGLEGK